MMKQEKSSDDNSILRFRAEKKNAEGKIAPADRDRAAGTFPKFQFAGTGRFRRMVSFSETDP